MSGSTATATATKASELRAAIAAEFARRFPKSKSLCERRGRTLLDQTSHAVRWAEPFQVTTAKAAGAEIVDLDGNRFVDYWQGHYANLLGHNPAFVRDELARALKDGRGLQSGAIHEIEAEVAELVVRRTGTEVVRFTTSGALGTFYSVLLARAFTRRSLVVKVGGGWHGSQPFALKGVNERAGSYDHLESEGLPKTAADDAVLVRFNDLEGLERVFAERGREIACFLVEPWLGSGGGIAARPEWLRAARRLTKQHGALLLCDEIISGFRFRAGDLSSMSGVAPDLLILGKVIGGGMPVAAVAGRREVMELASRAQKRVKFEGGTYSAHELSLVASRAMLSRLVEQEAAIYPRLGELGARLRAGIEALFAELSVPVWLSGWPNESTPGSSIVMFDLAAGRGGRPDSPDERIGPGRAHPFVDDELWRSLLLLEGVHARHGLGALSLAHGDAELERTLAAIRAALLRLRSAGLV
jgi:glutamate-1-semialdehyde 2,1-aminomutase